MKRVIKFFRPVIVLGLKLLWFITRPKLSGACVLILHNNEVLLVKTTYWPGYTLPGGGIKKGESPYEAGIREVSEEVGITLESITPVATFVFYEDYKIDTVHSFYSYVDSKAYKLDVLEIDSAEWFPLDALPELNPGATRIVEKYKQGISP